LKVYDECAKKENELHDAEMEMRKVALENMELQRIAAELKTKTNANANADIEACASMVRLGEASKEKKRREEEYRPRDAMVAETSVLIDGGISPRSICSGIHRCQGENHVAEAVGRSENG
jgi:hypothetical protein